MNITIVNQSEIPTKDKIFLEKNLEFFIPSDITKLMNISIENARAFFHREDFLTIMNGKNESLWSTTYT